MTALTADQEAYIAARVAAGDFERPEDVVFLAFQLLKERDRDAVRLHDLQSDLDLAIGQIADGRTSSRTAHDILDEIRARSESEVCAS